MGAVIKQPIHIGDKITFENKDYWISGYQIHPDSKKMYIEVKQITPPTTEKGEA